MNPTDQTLVDRARAGSRDATGELFTRHWPSAWRLACSVTGSREAAEDVAQDSFVKAIASLGRFDGRRPFNVWLHRIVVNRAIDHMRRERRTVSLEVAGEIGYEPTCTAGDPALADAVGRLPPDRRAVISLRYGLDYTPAEIADVLDLPIGTVHSRLARALTELRTTLEVKDAR